VTKNVMIATAMITIIMVEINKNKEKNKKEYLLRSRSNSTSVCFIYFCNFLCDFFIYQLELLHPITNLLIHLFDFLNFQ